jgi:hypothetical protein
MRSSKQKKDAVIILRAPLEAGRQPRDGIAPVGGRSWQTELSEKEKDADG